MEEITFRKDFNTGHWGIIWMKIDVKYLHLYTVLQKVSIKPLKVMGLGISLLKYTLWFYKKSLP